LIKDEKEREFGIEMKKLTAKEMAIAILMIIDGIIVIGMILSAWFFGHS